MEEDRMPTLFEILNRFSKPPVDLWSFYVFMKEQYGGVEYLEFWLDCAGHTALCKESAKEVLNSRRETQESNPEAMPRAMTSRSNAAYIAQHSHDEDGRPYSSSGHNDSSNGTSNLYFSSSSSQSHTRTTSGATSGVHYSPNSSMSFDILRDDVLDTGSDRRPRSRDQRSLMREEGQDTVDPLGMSRQRQFSTMSLERARNKRDTVSRLSEISDNMQMPEYPDATATSPTRDPRSADENIRRHRRLPSDLDETYELGLEGHPADQDARPYRDDPSSPERRRYKERQAYLEETLASLNGHDANQRRPPETPPPKLSAPNAGTSNLTSPNHAAQMHMHNNPVNNSQGHYGSEEEKNINRRASNVSMSQVRRAVHDSASRIIYTYSTPKSPKVIELPSDATGWSMAEDIRQASTIPGGLDNPKLFEPATVYVFDALEREALPAFLMYRASSNVQPVSATSRLVVGLLALFGGFWLSFVFVLLNWKPKSERCWVISPFASGWYLVITASYHIDPMLAFTSIGERDGGGFAKVQENFVRSMLVKRSVFVVAATTLSTAAFSVLFIFVPGHRL